jgi:prophage regulatory protein
MSNIKAARLRRLLRKPAVLDAYGKSESELYEDIANGTFPAPVPIGTRAVAWIESEVVEWQERRIAERDNQSAKRSLPLEEARQAGTLIRRGQTVRRVPRKS